MIVVSNSTPLITLAKLEHFGLLRRLFSDLVKARRLAAGEGLVMSGSIALLERSYQKGYLKDLRETYERLLSENIYVARRILNRSLAKFGLPALGPSTDGL